MNTVEFEKELTHLINKHSIDAKLKSFDFVLAKYVIACLNAYGEAANNNDSLIDKYVYGRKENEWVNVMEELPQVTQSGGKWYVDCDVLMALHGYPDKKELTVLAVRYDLSTRVFLSENGYVIERVTHWRLRNKT